MRAPDNRPLNLVNFLLAEVVGVILPFMSALLRQRGWGYAEIGVATAVAGLGTLAMQIPAGMIIDRVPQRRLLLAVASLGLGACYGALPLSARSHVTVYLLLAVAGACGAFFVPLLAALALAVAGRAGLDRTMGQNQGWNHAGNIAAALLALALVRYLGITSVFYAVAAISGMAAGSVFLVPARSAEPPADTPPAGFRELLSDPAARVLLASVALFHIANAPVMPLVGLYLKRLGGGNDQIAWVVLVAQAVMVPTAWAAGKFCGSRGRKPIFALAFAVLPIRIALYAMTRNPGLILAIQALDGIGAGIYGVVIALVCSDLTRGKGGFNTLMGMAQTALALGGVLGPLIQGIATERLGFPASFLILAGVAAAGAALFVARMPETLSTAGPSARAGAPVLSKSA